LFKHISKIRRKTGNANLTIIPSSEFLNTFLLNNRNFLEETLGCRLPLVNKELYLSLSNKWSSAKFLCRTE